VGKSVTVCESLVTDFSWLPGFLEWFLPLLADTGPVLALFGAIYLFYKKQEGDRRAARDDRNAKVAEETLIAVHEFDMALRTLRAHWTLPAPEDEADKRGYEWHQRLTRMQDHRADFEKLRQMEVRAKAFLGNTKIDSSIAELFAIWRKLWAALDSLSRADDDTRDVDMLKFYAGLRRNAAGSYSEEDEFGQRQIFALNTLQAELYPILRLETRQM
jgi:hypothetical protein